MEVEVPPRDQHSAETAAEAESAASSKEGEGGAGDMEMEDGYRGFTTEYQDYLFPIIDHHSSSLFDIVQTVERAMLNMNVKLLQGIKQPVPIPESRLAVPGGPEIRVKVLDPSEPLSVPPVPAAQSTSGGSKSKSQSPVKTLEEVGLAGLERQIVAAEKAFTPEKLEKLMVPFSLGWKREIVIRSHGGGASKKLGDVYYFNPQGVKYRSSKQIAAYLAKASKLKMTVENFSFAKARVSYDPEHETVRAAQGGRGLNPIKNQMHHHQKGGMLIGHQEEEDDMEDNDKKENSTARAGGRRSIQPPKRYAASEFVESPPKRIKMSGSAKQNNDSSSLMEMGMLPPKYKEEKEEKTGEQLLQEFKAKRAHMQTGAGSFGTSSSSGDNGPFFGISALTQGQYDNSDYGNQGSFAEDDGEVPQGQSGPADELLPCSIRCPGMTGEIPTLQCKRCLCLYHPGCLGLPDQPYRNFYCSNCEGDQSESQSPSPPKPQQQQQQTRVVLGQRGGLRILRRSEPPPLLQLNSGGMKPGQQMRKMLPPPGRGGFAPRGQGQPQQGLRLTPPLMRQGGVQFSGGLRGRGRGRPPRPMMPTGRGMGPGGVTITPIPSLRGTGRGMPPVIPKLTPMSGLKSQQMMRPGGMSSMNRAGSPRPPQPNQMMLLKRGGITNANLRQRPGLRGSLQSSPLRHSSLFSVAKDGRLIPRAATGPPVSSPSQMQQQQFQRYPQSVVTINQNKFIAVPKNPSKANNNNDERAEENEGKSAGTEAEGNVNGGGGGGTEDAEMNMELLEEEEEEDEVAKMKKVVKLLAPYLETKDKLAAMAICKTWKDALDESEAWSSLNLTNLELTDMEKCYAFLFKNGVEEMDLRNSIIPDPNAFWSKLATSDVSFLKRITVPADQLPEDDLQTQLAQQGVEIVALD